MYWAIEDVLTNCVPKFSTNDAGLIANVADAGAVMLAVVVAVVDDST